MNIRSFNPSDNYEARKIHEKHFKDEFDFPNFMRMHAAATIENDDNKIIIVGGIRPIAEIIAVTDKDASGKERREALYKFLQFCSFSGQSFRYDQLHAFVQEENLTKLLIKLNYRETKGKSLVCDI